MNAGDVFGEAAIFSEEGRTAGVKVIKDLRAIEVTRDAFERELNRGSWLQLFIKALAKRFKMLDLKR